MAIVSDVGVQLVARIPFFNLILTRFQPGVLALFRLIGLTVSTVSLISPFQAVSLHQEFVLVGKCPLAVMLFLTGNVIRNLVHAWEIEDIFVLLN